ncbi:hypothetical protein [Phaeobacter sp. B1627]|uniref:hypothetical protein n=1 Tax=Phaeobacter sp. B1627 TaxID=2583809 RepID=UPI00111AE73C|nr:hypothetical protein [Phaeobacter sp. B1627]TNJ44397.1 hypothetical protein FGE21_07590 [Phaeobacter sp. B1627]
MKRQMKPLTALVPALALTAGPALAHGGAHVHPHGAEVWLALALVAVVVLGCVSLMRGRK